MSLPSVDVHQHLWPDELIRALERRSAPPRLRGQRLELTVEPAADVDLDRHAVERRLELLDRDGIDLAVVSPSPAMELESCPDLRDAWHAGASELGRSSGGRLAPLSLGVRMPGFAGVCVSAPALVEGLGSLPGTLEEEGGFLFVHPGVPRPSPAGAPGWWPALADYTGQMQTAYLAWLHRDAPHHRALPVVFAMLAGGAPFQLERLAARGFDLRAAMLDNVYFDASSYGRRALELCLSTFGVTQLLYGSDAPVIDPRRTLSSVRAFGDTLAELVLCDNPARVLGHRPDEGSTLRT
ncbi:MAG: amidohydrolase family protein [Gaiellales bacterium]